MLITKSVFPEITGNRTGNRIQLHIDSLTSEKYLKQCNYCDFIFFLFIHDIRKIVNKYSFLLCVFLSYYNFISNIQNFERDTLKMHYSVLQSIILDTKNCWTSDYKLLRYQWRLDGTIYVFVDYY